MNVLPKHEQQIAPVDEQTALDDDASVKWRVYASSRQDFETDVLRAALDDGDNVVSARAFRRQKTAVVFQTRDEMVDAFRRLRDWAQEAEADDDVDPNVVVKAKGVAAGLKADLQSMGVDVDDFDVASPDADDTDADDQADDADADAETDGAAVSAVQVDAESQASDDPVDDQDSDQGADSDPSGAADTDGDQEVPEHVAPQGLVEALTRSQLRDYRAIILEGVEYEAQADEVGVEPHTVRSNISRGRQRIRDAGIDVPADPAV